MAEADIWNATSGQVQWTKYGGEFIIGGRGDSPTIQSNFYIFFGVVSVIMKAAKGQGIVSSIVLQSDDLDEVDWEFLGGDTTQVQTNYFGKGNTTSYDRGKYFPMDPPQDDFHNYTVRWTKEQLEWWVDDRHLRTLMYNEALNGYNYPQTPMNIRLGIWAAGDPDNSQGVIEWGGGLTDFHTGPFTMTVESVYAEDYSTGKEYVWTDHSGSWQSIKATEGISNAEKVINRPHGLSQRWNALPSGARAAIVGGSIGGVVMLAAIIAFCCFKQRRVGRKENAAFEAEQQKEQLEFAEYKKRMTSGGFGYGNAGAAR